MLYKGYDSWVEKDEKGEIHQQGSGFTGIVSSAEQLFWGIHGMAGLDDLKIISVYRFHYDENGNHTSVNHHIMTETVGKIVYAGENPKSVHFKKYHECIDYNIILFKPTIS